MVLRVYFRLDPPFLYFHLPESLLSELWFVIIIGWRPVRQAIPPSLKDLIDQAMLGSRDLELVSSLAETGSYLVARARFLVPLDIRKLYLFYDFLHWLGRLLFLCRLGQLWWSLLESLMLRMRAGMLILSMRLALSLLFLMFRRRTRSCLSFDRYLGLNGRNSSVLVFIVTFHQGPSLLDDLDKVVLPPRRLARAPLTNRNSLGNNSGRPSIPAPTRTVSSQ